MDLNIGWFLLPFWGFAFFRFSKTPYFGAVRISVRLFVGSFWNTTIEMLGDYMAGHIMRARIRRMAGKPAHPTVKLLPVPFVGEVILWDLALISFFVSGYFIYENIIADPALIQLMDKYYPGFAKEGMSYFYKQLPIESLKTKTKSSDISVVSPSASNIIPGTTTTTTTTGAGASQPVSPEIVETKKVRYGFWCVCVLIIAYFCS